MIIELIFEEEKIEKEIIEIQKYFYLKDKRYFEKDFNFKGKNLSRIILDIENQILQIIILLAKM